MLTSHVRLYLMACPHVLMLAAPHRYAHAFRWYNDKPYQRRGWCKFESGASNEMVARVSPSAHLPAKLVDISGEAPMPVNDLADDMMPEAPR
jgi:hypothetical protein